MQEGHGMQEKKNIGQKKKKNNSKTIDTNTVIILNVNELNDPNK